MTGYNEAHGDTAAVKLILDNTREYRDTVIERIDSFVRWTGSTWVGVPRAAESIRYYTQTIAGKADAADEIRDADLSAVNWTAIVSDDLAERNLEAGRDALAGLTHAVYRDGEPLTARMSEDDCFVWIQKNQSKSVDLAIKEEGYEIKAVA